MSSFAVVPGYSSLLIIRQLLAQAVYIYATRERLPPLYSNSLSTVVSTRFMSSQQEQAAVQAASDAYVAAHQEALL